MPLLHKAAYQFRSVPQDLTNEDEVFHIRASKEVFKTYEEYIAKAQLYTKEVWSCSLTGKSNLTLEEAMEAEALARKKLEKFPAVLEKPTLLLAHHSQKNLDWMATTLTNQYKSHCAVGEIVTVAVGEEKKTGKIVECVTSLDADEGDDSMYTYKIMLLGTGEQITGIPHANVERKLVMPTKELIKMFIREHTNKQSNMFNVKKDMLIKYNIPHKFATITSVLRTPKASDKPGKKPGPRMINNKPSSATKNKHTFQKTIAVSKTNTGPKMIKIHSVGEDGRLKTTWKEIPSKTPQKISPKPTNNNVSAPAVIEEITISDSDSDRKSKTATTADKPKKTPLTDEQKKERKQKREENKEIKEFTNKVKNLVEKYKDQIAPKAETADTPTKNLKQTSLLSYTNKNSISTTIREIIGAEDNGYRRSMIINDLAKAMTKTVSQKLPLATPVKSLLLEKREKLLEREKLNAMSLDEREMYMREKEEERIAVLQRKREEKLAEQQKLKDERMRQREIERESARQARLAQQALERIIIDDLSLDDSTPLPPYIPIDLPEGIGPESFPKVALVADAIHFFRHIFTQPEDDINYNSDLLFQACLDGPRGHKVLSNLLISMLQTLGQELRDKVKIPQLDVSLGTVDLSEFNVGACVLVYITYLLQKEEHEDSELDEIAQSLQKSEFYDLPPRHKIHVLYVLVDEIIRTRTFNAAIDDHIERTTKARKEIQAQAILRNKQKQSEKLKQMQETLKKGLGGVIGVVQVDSDREEDKEDDEEKDTGCTVLSDDDKEDDGDEGIGSDEEDVSKLAHVVRKRREDVKRRKEEEKEEKVKQEAERIKEKKFREQQALIHSRRKKEEQLKAELDNLVLSIRNEPLGMDRNYARYWLFHGVAGFYIEQGWWDTRHFSSVEKPENGLNTSNNSEQSGDSGIQEKPQQVLTPKEHSTAWYVIPSVAHLDELKSALNRRGTREKALLAALNKEDERIRAAIRKMNYPSRQHRLIGNVEATIKTLKKEIRTMDESLGYTGLGGVDNIINYIKQDLCTVEQCSEAILAIQESVDAKYMKKPMCSIFSTGDLTYTYNDKVQVWCDMVEASSTYSDLHMLLSIFDNCIKWERSIENITCRSCKKKGDERKLLICDVCDTGYHCGCLRPPLKKVPSGDWLCPECVPVVEKEEAGSDSGECSEEEQRDDDEEESNDDYCCVCELGGELILCDKCPSAFHLTCHDPPLKRIPRGDWACYKCLDNNSESEQEEEEEGSDDQNIDNCSVCNKGGSLLVCHECEETYHMKCHDPPIKSVPGKRWKCSLCKPPPEESKPKKRSSSASNKGKAGKKRKVEKKQRRSRTEQLKSDEEEESETATEEEEEEEEKRRSSKSKSKTSNKAQKKQRKSRTEQLKSDEEEESETATEEEEEEEEKRRSSKSKSKTSNKSRGTRKRPSRAARDETQDDDETSSTRGDRSNRRSLKRGIDQNLELCEEMISDLLKIPESADFIDLVDKKKVPDYYDLIERPICLSQIKEKTLYLQYETCDEFVEDFMTLLDNCFNYNLEQSEVYENGKVLESSFLSMLKSRLPNIHRTIVKSRRSM